MATEGSAIADKHAKHASNDAAGLKDGLPYEATAETHDIFDDVAANQGDGGNCAIKTPWANAGPNTNERQNQAAHPDPAELSSLKRSMR